MSKTIYLNAEHGGSDTGAVSGSFIERDINLKVTDYCKAYLSNYGCNIVMSRTNNSQEPLIKERNAQVAEIRPDCVVTIAHNAGGGDGCEVYYQSGDSKGRSLADEVITQFKAIGQNSRGAKASSGDYGMCREPSKLGIPAVLGEFAFLDNENDRELISTDARLKSEGEAYGKAIVKYLNLSKKEEEKVTTGKYKLLDNMGFRERPDGSYIFKNSPNIPKNTVINVIETTKSFLGTLWGKHVYNGKTGWTAIDPSKKYAVKVSEETNPAPNPSEPNPAAQTVPKEVYDKAVRERDNLKTVLNQINSLSKI